MYRSEYHAACVYRLVLKDPKLKKLVPSTMGIGTYTADAVKIVVSCIFYLVHPDTKKLWEVTFLLLKMMAVSSSHAQLHLHLD